MFTIDNIRPEEIRARLEQAVAAARLPHEKVKAVMNLRSDLEALGGAVRDTPYQTDYFRGVDYLNEELRLQQKAITSAKKREVKERRAKEAAQKAQAAVAAPSMATSMPTNAATVRKQEKGCHAETTNTVMPHIDVRYTMRPAPVAPQIDWPAND
ncbi:hypothetical protein PbB2_02793 [Candidatus Phycosocius bacilliformis]|uniref:Uncharacterized protein n=1 Tax=Candidatus Phycosocius bacilliformis TaxID=1445552 RepID=A0A2P2EDI7_9PROT|nr:hypothetical protein [Candidatus Phycosocius bacilliformis]GBF59101.1 hypothetical protein PbB2_02793 [Candidatus Phycosocius bacilliformis]